MAVPKGKGQIPHLAHGRALQALYLSFFIIEGTGLHLGQVLDDKRYKVYAAACPARPPFGS